MLFLCPYARRVTLYAFLMIFTMMARSQDPNSGNTLMQYNRSASPSGNTSFLNAAASISPSLYTGGLGISLPIYTLTGSDLKIPITIGYTAANGVRPSDPNATVGMDWALAAGGSIARTVRGLPDETTNGYLGTNQEGATAVTDFNNKNTSVWNFNNTLNNVNHQSIIDGEPDIFVVSTPMFSVQFTIDPQSGQAVFVGGNSGLQVVHHLYNNSGTPYGITIIDPQGTQYVFGSSTVSTETTTTTFFGQSFTYISTWYLEKIILLNSKDIATFSYTAGANYTVYSYLQPFDFSVDYPSGSGFPPTGGPSSYPSIDPDNRAIDINTTVYNSPKYISQIITEQGEADFAYTSTENSNIYTSNPPELSTITIKQFNPITNGNTTVLETFNLAFTAIETGLTGYTQPFPYSGIWSDYYRRLLTSISVTGNTSTTSTPLTLYALQYYQSLPYPDRALTEVVDYWGYPNTTSADYFVNFNNYYVTPNSYRQPNTISVSGQTIPMAALFALQQITELGGASTVFNYQPNYFYNGSANQPGGGACIGSIVKQLPTGETLTTSYNYFNANGNSTGQIWNDLYSKVTTYFGSSCCNFVGLSYSTSPYGIADENDVTIGYSSVTVTNPNGGYTVNNFTNFSDFPDNLTDPPFFASSATVNSYGASEILSSFAYKRGLPISTIAYNANGNMVSQDINTYGSLDAQPAVKEIGIQDNSWWEDLSSTFPDALDLLDVNVYNSNIENWRLKQTVHQDYDQVIPTSYIQRTTTYTYTPDERQIRSISTADSKGQKDSIIYYYSGDINYSQVTIPDITSSERTALTAMASTAVNATGILVHQVVNRNGTVHQKHFSYSAISLGVGTNYYQTSDATYTGSTLESQNSYNYDPSTSQMISSQAVGDMSVSAMYAYNNSYPVAEIRNSSSSATYTIQQTTRSGSVQSVPGSLTFTTGYAGTITLSEIAANGTGVNFNLLGPIDVNSSMCYGTGCGVYASSYTISNAPAGTYTLSVTAGSGSGATITCTYPYLNIAHTSTAEYFFEGFEQNTAATAGSAHTGTMYYNGNYTVTYSPPNSRKYLIQWWNLSGSQWVFNQQPYTTGMTLSGPVDDVRVFPSDALMTTYTYSPLLGKTSETDPSGKSKIYEYDGLGRLQDIRDQNGNLLKQYSYQYQTGLSN
jgi:YD repeat-containing protein